jgi:hypothetical protein
MAAAEVQDPIIMVMREVVTQLTECCRTCKCTREEYKEGCVADGPKVELVQTHGIGGRISL